MAWTTQQKKAIDIRNKNLLVAAAAGSGKTAVLVERITKLAVEEENFDVDKMLVVTFTNAAAQEMKTRIHKNFLKLIETETDSEKISKLERQSILLSGASIMTFHAFCLSVIKQHFSKIDLDPKFREADEHELEILKQEVIEKLFEDKYQDDDEKFNKFTDTFGGSVKGDDELHKMIITLYNFAQSRPYPETWLKNFAECYKNPETFKLDNGMTWIDFIMSAALEESQKIISGICENFSAAYEDAAKQIIPDAVIAKNWSQVVAFLDAEKNFFLDIKKSSDDWEKLRAKLSAEIKFKTFKTPKNLPDDLKAVKDSILDVRDDCKKKLGDLKNFVSVSRKDVLAEIKEVSESILQLAQVTIDFEKEFSAAKRERGIIDFDDMEHLALKIFNSDKRTAKIYRDKFKVVMVDEYQDTNDVQEEIISKIVGENNFFAVGDVKQSIYKFRNAAPEIFLRKYKSYPALENSERIDLSKNFRSRKQVVDAVNSIFRKIMTEDAMEIEYDKDAELNFGAVESYPPAENSFDEKAEFLIVTQESGKKNQSQNANNDDDLDNLEKEVQLIANKINSMIKAGKKVWDGEKYRDLEYRDIVILLRSTDGKATKISDILHDNNIPAYAEDKGGYFRAKEIQTILNLLNLLDNVRQDIPLAAVMLSPIGGFSAEDLTKMRIDNRKDELFILVNVCAMGNDELGLRCLDFLKKINRWRELSRQVSVPELLTTIYRETGYYDFFDNAAGKIPQANLRILIDRAAEFEKTAFRGLSRFIQFVKKIRDLGNDLSTARTLGENENVVRIMTIHKSKGLEFPVVFAMHLGKKINTLDLNETIIAHRNFGIGVCKVIEDNSGIKRISIFARKVLEKKMRGEILAEELRILYVAFTRAKEKLFLVGSCNEKIFDKYEEMEQEEKISAQKLQSVHNAMEWLLMAKDEKFFDIETFDDSSISKTVLEKVPEKVEEEKISHEVEKAETSPLENVPAKLSVTELKRRIFAEEETENNSSLLSPHSKLAYRRPKFIQQTSMTGAEFGTLMHSVMQHLNLQKNLDAKNISAQIDEMVGAEIFTVEEGEILKKHSANIEKFFESSIGKKILSARKIYRELPFSHYIDAEKIQAENFQKATGEKIFVQGIIDLLFQDSAGEWILLDYKTDKNNTDEHFQKEYREQIKFYVRAIETLLNLQIGKKYLYLLGASRLIEMAE